MEPNSVPPSVLEGHLVSSTVHSKSVMAFVPTGLPSTSGVNFHYNDGIMGFEVDLWSIFPPS